MKISVTIGKEEFTTGIRRSPICCAFALGIGKAVPDKFVWLGQVGNKSDYTVRYVVSVYDNMPDWIVLDPSCTYGYRVDNNIVRDTTKPSLGCIAPDYLKGIIVSFDKGQTIPNTISFELDLLPWDPAFLKL